MSSQNPAGRYVERLYRGELDVRSDGTVGIFSGTTVENYRTCCYLDADRGVVFDKTAEPGHQLPDFYYTFGFHGAAFWALKRARELDHSPLVIEGRTHDSSNYSALRPPSCKVDGIWVPKGETDWRSLDPSDESLVLFQYFQREEPSELLE